MRLYSFVNYYLSPLQHGLQTAHVVSEMSVVADCKNGEADSNYWSWAKSYRTIIIKNGGNSWELEELFVKLQDFGQQFDLPVSAFREDKASLNCAMTAVGIIIPEEYYEAKFIRGSGYTESYYYNKKLSKKYDYVSNEYKFMELFNGYRLA